MRCPYCAFLEDKVVDSREGKDGLTIRRRRECLKCGKRFTSYERLEEITYMVIKRDGRRAPFDRARVMSGLLKACEKRPVPLKDLEAVADEVEGLLSDQPDRELPTEAIGGHVMKRLRDLDQVAYVRFASVYRRFEDVAEFMNELQDLLHTRSTKTRPKAARGGSPR
jgi:transcriptional repressor NrdR